MMTRRHSGFTFIEMMLVIAVIAILSAMLLPDMARSIKGNRLRSASRTVVSTGKYARSLAVMRQEEMVLTFDLDLGVVTAHGFQVASALSEPEDDDGEIEALDGSVAPIEEEVAASSIRFAEPEIEKLLERVTIELVRVGDGLDITQGKCHVLYYPNGRCDRYEVVVRDAGGAAMLVKIDSLAGVDVRKVDS